jgi:hypothetical protein
MSWTRPKPPIKGGSGPEEEEEEEDGRELLATEVLSSSLYILRHRSPVWIITHRMYLLCTSLYILGTKIFNF